ncbi:MAG: HD domain-containing protein [Clostridium perfringens]|nr:HD domain-containing protein [Clostridium perfringens]
MEIKSIISETTEEFFYELENHLLFDEKPSLFLKEVLFNNDDYSSYNNLIKALYDLKDIKQNPKFHPEGDALTHTLYAVDEAAKYRNLAHNKREFMLAALLHDIGKAKTTLLDDSNNIIDDHHDLVSGEMARRILRNYISDITIRDNIVSLIKHHMTHFYVLNKIKTGMVLNMIETTDIHDVALLSLCDRLGKGNLSKDVKEATLNNINKFLAIMSSKTGITYEKIFITF